MDLNSLKFRFSLVSLFLIAPILTLVTPAFTQSPQPQGPCVNQSPRQIVFDQTRQTPPAQGVDYNFTSTIPLVNVDPPNPEVIQYQAHTLQRCDQHYHYPVENIQGCSTDTKGTQPAETKKNEPGPPPPLGQWIEMHTVYAAEISTTGECASGLDHDLRCCLKPPFVVLAFHAKVETKDFLPPRPTDSVEWSGSRTGKDDSTGCRELPAFWHFALSCQATLTQGYLEHIGAPHYARAAQSPNRVSTDLTFVPAEGTPVDPTKTCRSIKTESILNTAAANRICPGVCRSPLNQPSMIYGHVNWTQYGSQKNGYAVCVCCPLDRPQ